MDSEALFPSFYEKKFRNEMFIVGENGIDQKIALSRSVLNKWYDHLSRSYAEAWKNIAKLEARKNTIYDPAKMIKAQWILSHENK